MLAVRPLVLPFLHRLQMRLQSAIDHSSIAAGQAAMALQVAAAVAALDELRANSARLQIGIDAVRLDLHELIRKHDDETGSVLRTLSSAQEEQRIFAGHLMSRADLLIRRSSLLPLGSEVLAQTPEGLLLVPADDRTLLAAMLYSGGRLEPGTVKVLTALLREGDQVIDVGAHIGLTVLPAASKVGPRGRVVALEPGTRAASLLRQGLALNGLTECVTVHQCAAGDEEGKARLHLSPILGESSLLELDASHGSEEVDVHTIDSLVEPGRSVRLVKIDAEGYEPQVWRGMQRIVNDNPELAVIIEFGPVHLLRASISIEDWLAGFVASGFTLYEVDELSGSVRPIRAVAALRIVTSLNLLMLKLPPATYPELQFE